MALVCMYREKKNTCLDFLGGESRKITILLRLGKYGVTSKGKKKLILYIERANKQKFINIVHLFGELINYHRIDSLIFTHVYQGFFSSFHLFTDIS